MSAAGVGVGVAGGTALYNYGKTNVGGYFGKNKAKDITSQLSAVQSNASANRIANDNLYADLQTSGNQYQLDMAAALQKARQDAEQQKGQFLGNTDAITKEAKDALRANLYSDTFSGLPDTLKAVREAAAAGSGINSGAYQQAVGNVGVNTARTLATGERDIQLQGLQNKQNAETQAYTVFSNLTSKLSDQNMDRITKALDTGREDLVRRTTTEMGLNDDETQAIVDLLNFQQTGQMAQRAADNANQQALYNALIQGGTTLATSYGGKGK